VLNIKAGLMFLLALVLGTGAAIMAFGWIQQQSASAPDDDENVLVYVATRDIDYGESIDKSHLKAVEWPRERVPTGAILATEDVTGKLVNQRVLAEELLMSARIADKLPGSRLSSIVRPNLRAITVRVNDVAGVAGFLLPGNRVDVLATRMEDRRAITSTLLQNIKVLAVDQKANSAKDEPIVVRAVTLEANLDAAAQLASATEEGTIQLVLRNPEDHGTESPKIVQLNKQDISNDVPELAAATSGVKKKKKVNATSTLTIIRGTDVVRTNLRQ